MDQFVSIHGKRDSALFLDCRSLEWKTVPLPEGTRLIVADSKVRRELAASEFNVRRGECEEAVAELRPVLPGIRSLRDVAPEELERYGERLPTVLWRRARHVVGEIARVAAVIAEVERGDAAALGRAMTDAHQSGRFLYEVSCDELDLLVETAIGLDGCYGSRLTGAGFGGCTVSLVTAAAAEEFARTLARVYLDATGRRADVWICRAADGMSVRLS
jgi:galactokinase